MMGGLGEAIDLPEARIKALAEPHKPLGPPPAAILQRTGFEYRGRLSAKPIEAASGLWDSDTTDGLDHQRQIRAEW